MQDCTYKKEVGLVTDHLTTKPPFNMLTPIQKLIKDFRNGRFALLKRNQVDNILKEYLEAEKEEIKEAFYQGGWTANRWTGSTMNTTPEDYYKMKFKK